jgi:hypothetical protein
LVEEHLYASEEKRESIGRNSISVQIDAIRQCLILLYAIKRKKHRLDTATEQFSKQILFLVFQMTQQMAACQMSEF